MTMVSDSADRAPAASPRVEVGVIGAGQGDGEGQAYQMFDLVRLDERRAFLGGPLLFELGEELLLELRRGADRVRVRARVVRVERGDGAGVEVELVGVGAGEQPVLARMRATQR
jgi:hypothetical protein